MPVPGPRKIADASDRTLRPEAHVSKRSLAVPVVDDVVLRRLLALRDEVARPGENLLGELLTLFAQDTQARIHTIRSALARGDHAACKRAAHAIKGAAGNIGATRVAHLAAQLEGADLSRGDVDQLEAEVSAALRLLEERLLAPGTR